MTTFTVGNTGFTYTSIQAAHDAIPSNPSDDYTIEINTATAFDSGGVILSVSNSNNKLLKVTAIDSVKVAAPTYASATSKARISGSGNCLNITGTGWTIEKISFISTGAFRICVDISGVAATVRRCGAIATNNDTYCFVSENSGAIATFSNLFAITTGSGNIGIASYGSGVQTSYYCSVLSANIGFYNTGTGTAYACVVNAGANGSFSGSFSGNENVANDTYTPGQTTWQNQSSFFVNVSSTTEDLSSNKIAGTYSVTDYSPTVSDTTTDLKGTTRDFAIDAGVDEVVTIYTVGNAGGLYTSFQSAHDAIPSNPLSDYTLQAITATAFDSGGLTLSVSNSNAVQFLVTATDAVKVAAPTNSSMSAKARITGLVEIDTAGWIYEKVSIIKSSSDAFYAFAPAILRNTVVSLGTGGAGWAIYAALTGSFVVENVAVFIPRNDNSCIGIQCAGGSSIVNVYHCSVSSSVGTGTLINNINASAVNCYACITQGAGTNFGGTIGGNQNVSQDTSAPGATNWHSQTGVFTTTTAGSENLNLAGASGTYTVSDYSLLANLQAYWKLDVNALDSSGNANNGTLVNGTHPGIGQVVGAMQFDGTDDYISVNNASSLQISNPFTLSVWFKPANLTQTNTYVIGKVNGTGGGTDSDYSIIWEYNNNKINYYSSTFYDPTNASISIGDTNWHHIVYAYDGTSYFGYLDGASAFTPVNSGASAPTSTGKFYIGAFNTGAAFINANIDEVRVYNRALSATEVAELYYHGVGRGIPMLYYDLNGVARVAPIDAGCVQASASSSSSSCRSSSSSSSCRSSSSSSSSSRSSSSSSSSCRSSSSSSSRSSSSSSSSSCLSSSSSSSSGGKSSSSSSISSSSSSSSSRSSSSSSSSSRSSSSSSSSSRSSSSSSSSSRSSSSSSCSSSSSSCRSSSSSSSSFSSSSSSSCRSSSSSCSSSSSSCLSSSSSSSSRSSSSSSSSSSCRSSSSSSSSSNNSSSSSSSSSSSRSSSSSSSSKSSSSSSSSSCKSSSSSSSSRSSSSSSSSSSSCKSSSSSSSNSSSSSSSSSSSCLSSSSSSSSSCRSSSSSSCSSSSCFSSSSCSSSSCRSSSCSSSSCQSSSSSSSSSAFSLSSSSSSSSKGLEFYSLRKSKLPGILITQILSNFRKSSLKEFNRRSKMPVKERGAHDV